MAVSKSLPCLLAMLIFLPDTASLSRSAFLNPPSLCGSHLATPTSCTLRLAPRTPCTFRASRSTLRMKASPSTPTTASWAPLIGLCALSVLICYADRSNLSDAILPMSAEFGWGKSSEGMVLSSFFIGYALTQVIGGGLADTFGGARVLGGAVFLWSLATVFTPAAAALGLPPLIAMRVAMGVGEGPAFPAIHSIISRGVPAESRSTAVAAVTASSYVGCVAALSLSPGIIDSMGWPFVFYSFGAAGFLWLPVWAVFGSAGGFPSPPVASVSESMSESEVTQGGSSTLGSSVMLVKRLAKEKGVWAILAAQYTQSWGLYGMLGWLPTLISERYGVPFTELANFTVLPYAVQGVVGLLSGVLADEMIKGGMRPKECRKALQGVGMVGPAIALLAAATLANTPEQALALFTVGLGMSALTLGGVSAAHLDLSPSHGGIIFGMGNTLGTFGGFVSTWACGSVQEAFHSWSAVLIVIAAHYLVGALLFHLWADDTSLDY